MTKRVIKTYIEHCYGCQVQIIFAGINDREAISNLKNHGWTYAVTRAERTMLLCKTCSITERTRGG